MRDRNITVSGIEPSTFVSFQLREVPRIWIYPVFTIFTFTIMPLVYPKMLPNGYLLLSLGTTVMPWRNWKQSMVMKNCFRRKKGVLWSIWKWWKIWQTKLIPSYIAYRETLKKTTASWQKVWLFNLVKISYLMIEIRSYQSIFKKIYLAKIFNVVDSLSNAFGAGKFDNKIRPKGVRRSY